ncbi:transposable element Tc1 transposase [Trichonephila clavipes]|uniref:Transposable element Tc1 transposase n=1 Tax=Trichonephila clavipes TaxID=2585209 RepID=A0A8X6SI33_TRICX|nr:transposable element Tc1 transposase [Trichonephila clavipes]
MLAKIGNENRFHCHDGSGQPQGTADREDRLIVNLAVTASDSSLPTTRRATRTRVSTMTLHRRLTDRQLVPTATPPAPHACTLPSQNTVRRPGQHADPAFTIARHAGPQPGVLLTAVSLWSSFETLLQHSGTSTTFGELFCYRSFRFIFQQDNARPHKAYVAMNCLTACQTLPSQARSPDLSPIEQVWDMMRI